MIFFYARFSLVGDWGKNVKSISQNVSKLLQWQLTVPITLMLTLLLMLTLQLMLIAESKLKNADCYFLWLKSICQIYYKAKTQIMSAIVFHTKLIFVNFAYFDSIWQKLAYTEIV